ncbi:RibD family protein [Aquabacter sp. L1I39]|nr:RibD family protein [Aquabacter sp. L1I39]
MQDYDPFSDPFASSERDDRPVVIGQLGQSLDGRIATPSGDSKYISGSHALDHLHRLRAASDAVLVGVGTVMADDPLLNVRRVPGRNPARVILDPSGRVNVAAKCLADDGARRILIRRSGCAQPVPAGIETLDLPTDRDGVLAPAEVLAALAGAGLRRILLEGGPRTLAAFVDAGCIDRLHVVVSPVILGSGRTGLDLRPIASLRAAMRPPTHLTVFPDGDVLFDCDLRQSGRSKNGSR